ncbi:MAG: hypothetical protein B6I26_07185 [Desulfobacteraceae bacterium 4572_130]|nr:MAG: hypothetical protein B6I26_07185 [Desulfobacteraceae bacterium 4572_130]
MKVNIDAVKESIETLKKDIKELESKFDNWDSKSTAGGKPLRSITGRILLSAQRVKNLVKDNTYSP